MIPSGLSSVHVEIKLILIFRLLLLLESAIMDQSLCCWSTPFPSQGQSQYAHQAMELLKASFKVSDPGDSSNFHPFFHAGTSE